MTNIFKTLLNVVSSCGEVTMCLMRGNSASIDVTIKGESYMLTIYKEAKKDAD